MTISVQTNNTIEQAIALAIPQPISTRVVDIGAEKTGRPTTSLSKKAPKEGNATTQEATLIVESLQDPTTKDTRGEKKRVPKERKVG